MKTIKTYAMGVVIALAVGGISALLTSGNMMLYQEINQPPLAPPGFLFPIVWTILFILMGISSAMVYITAPDKSQKALTVYALQLVVNFAWSLIFFNLRAFFFAFIWILLLLALIVWMIYEFWKINKVAAYLQIPYLLWTTFATYLNLGVYLLNR